jgi:hypothetical protein
MTHDLNFPSQPDFVGDLDQSGPTIKAVPLASLPELPVAGQAVHCARRVRRH